MAAYNEESIRNYADTQTNTAFIDNILNNDNIQIHGSIDTFANNNGAHMRQLVCSDSTASSTEPTISDSSLEEFKNQVKIWIRLDNEVKELTNKMKVLDNERKQRKKYMASLTPFILTYMTQNDIEELNSRYGRLRSNSSLVKIPQTMKTVKEKLYSKFEQNSEYLDSIFKNREKVEKVTLKRLTN